MGLWYVIRQIVTIARHSVLQAIRMKVVIVLAVFLVILVPALPFLLKSDNTHEGQIRMILTYSAYLTSFLLSVLTLFLSVATLNNEIKGQHILLLDPKPIPRFAVLLGKWLGVMLINFVLLAGMLGATYGLVRYFGRRQPGEPERAHEGVDAKLLTARVGKYPPLPDLGKAIDDTVALMKKNNMMPEKKTEEWVRQRLAEQYSKSAWRVPPNTTQTWEIAGIPQFDGWLVIRFRFYGDKGKHDHELPCRFVVNEGGTPEVSVPERGVGLFRVNKLHSFAVRSSVVREDGTVSIRFTNFDRKGVAALFPFQAGMNVLYPVATLAENFARAGAVMLVRLSFVAILGIFASTFLSFPVGVLLTTVVFAIGHARNFIVLDILSDLYLFGTSMVPPGTPMNPIDLFLRRALFYFFSIFPNFSPYDVVPMLSEGYLVGTGMIVDSFLWLILVRGGLLTVAGWYIFRRRELAALTPAA